MLHISICDDEKLTADRIKGIVEESLKKRELPVVVEIYPEGDKFINKYAFRDDELIIIDMDMKEYPVFEMIGKLEEMNRNNLLILVTNQDHLALEAMPYGPFQIIRKKDMERDIPKAIFRYVRLKKHRNGIIEFTKNKGVIHIEKKKVLYLEKCKYNVYLHMRDGSIFTAKKCMHECESVLSGKGFIRTHSGDMVNVDYCYKIEKQNMVLKNGERIPISRERMDAVREQFMIGDML